MVFELLMLVCRKLASTKVTVLFLLYRVYLRSLILFNKKTFIRPVILLFPAEIFRQTIHFLWQTDACFRFFMYFCKH